MQLQTKPKQRYYTPEEYLELEEKSQEKNEYRNGEIIPMVGATTNHNQIAGNVYKLFPLNIDNQDYYVYIESVKLWLSEHNIYTYPDVMVIKDKPIHHGSSKSNVINPQIIIEVLSSSTEAYDRGDKFEYYRSLSTFQEYILIEQDRYSITQYIKQDNNNWLVNFYTGEEAILKLGSVNWEISLKDIYQRIDFEAVEEDS
ncbi:MAG: Uma2 family endonuclease [Crocosphaera sp.]